MFKPCVVIPVYNHERAVGAVVEAVVAQNLPCILVDDASSAECARLLDVMAAARPGRLILLRHAVNRGKGRGRADRRAACCATGLQPCAPDRCGWSTPVRRYSAFCRAGTSSSRGAVIVGYAKYDATVPWLRLCARYLTHVWVWINTLSLQIKDSMCGFRVYPLPPLMMLDQQRKLGRRMNFDIEVLVRLYWQGIESDQRADGRELSQRRALAFSRLAWITC